MRPGKVVVASAVRLDVGGKQAMGKEGEERTEAVNESASRRRWEGISERKSSTTEGR
jgi:hypothetical protein